MAAEVEGRAPGIAEVDGCIDLQEVVIGAEVDVATPSVNDPAADAGVEAKRIADGRHPIANLRSIAIAPTDIRQWVVHFDLEKRKIGLGVAPVDAGGMRLSVLESHRHFFGLLDDVVLCDDVTVGIDNETRAHRFDRHFRRPEELPQLVKRRGRQTAVGAPVLRAPEARGVFFANCHRARSLNSRDMDYCRHHSLHDRARLGIRTWFWGRLSG